MFFQPRINMQSLHKSSVAVLGVDIGASQHSNSSCRIFTYRLFEINDDLSASFPNPPKRLRRICLLLNKTSYDQIILTQS